jgi:hypothetical protein
MSFAVCELDPSSSEEGLGGEESLDSGRCGNPDLRMLAGIIGPFRNTAQDIVHDAACATYHRTKRRL